MRWLLRLLHLGRVDIHILDENRKRVFQFPFIWWSGAMKQKMYGTIPLKKRLEMETWLGGYLKEYATDIRAKIHADREGWYAEFHFEWGMYVRNALRKAGFNEKFLGVGNLDDIYVEAIEHSVLVNSAGEIVADLPKTTIEITHFWTTRKILAAVIVGFAFARAIVSFLSDMGQ